MARKGRDVPSGEAVQRQVGRMLANAALVVLCLGVIGAWSWFGFYQLEPGQSAVILRFGRYVGTEAQPGLRWHLPPPVESHEVVNVSSIDREEFGYPADRNVEPGEDQRLEAAMQTADNNIVHLSFAVHYRVKNAFESRYRVAAPRAILRDAAQAAVRRVVGRNTIDGVLSDKRGVVESDARRILQGVLDRYESGLEVLRIELLDVQPPPQVREAFDDVLAANQDRSRAVNEAQGYANEVLPKARAEALELLEQARGYRDARIAEATGEAERFRVVEREYARAPEVVRTRLFVETMEEVLPSVHTVIIEPGTPVLPHLPLERLRQESER